MSKLLDPKILMAIKDLSLSAKMTIDGFMNGINKSTLKGPGLEFSQYRSYQPGDDLRSLDWKMFARSDRYYIRESEVETNIAVRILIDASASMNHNDGDFTKIDYAMYLGASLAYLANLQGDAVGLYVMKNSGIFSMTPKQDYQHLARLFYQLEQIRPDGAFTQPIHYKELFAGTQKRELLIFITDLYQKNDEMIRLLDTLNSLRHETVVFHVLSRNELNLDFKGYTSFEDLETGETIQIDQNKARTHYQNKLNAYLEETRIKLLDRRIFYRTIVTDESLDQALRDFLKQRSKLRI
ncbi:DUF58 domain-containing protein [Pedobacter zeae]|uniref:Uncharacterized protein (DUF58 family) n=1 Tax=Pedobacter zeae TaxID=1737356 RepID=A0A7W6KCC8_9SPHI|nr:DUF58 domain-containing protein [Pedobacter zeae]MBB4108211.1 uncharacterized protein (DUF58 family) [Pedobacter zeae]GGG94324.1 hypothetical protein GCM10007422_04580 [Pedobacter zeae]